MSANLEPKAARMVLFYSTISLASRSVRYSRVTADGLKGSLSGCHERELPIGSVSRNSSPEYGSAHNLTFRRQLCCMLPAGLAKIRLLGITRSLGLGPLLRMAFLWSPTPRLRKASLARILLSGRFQ